MSTLIGIIHVFVCFVLVITVLLQAGKGGGVGLAFGAGGSNTVFGGSGAGNFLTRFTAICAVVFMMTSLSLAYFASASESSRLKEAEATQSTKRKVRDKAKAEVEAKKSAQQKLAAA